MGHLAIWKEKNQYATISERKEIEHSLLQTKIWGVVGGCVIATAFLVGMRYNFVGRRAGVIVEKYRVAWLSTPMSCFSLIPAGISYNAFQRRSFKFFERLHAIHQLDEERLEKLRPSKRSYHSGPVHYIPPVTGSLRSSGGSGITGPSSPFNGLFDL